MTRSLHRRQPATPLRLLSSLILCGALGACAVGPDYVRPAVDVGTQYKEGQDDTPGWRPARPSDAAERGAWWRIYQDPVLDDLMNRLDAANLDIAQAEANYRQAQALVRGARSAFFPTVGVGAGVTRSGSSAGTGSGTGGGSTVVNAYSLTGTVSWEADLWGSVRRSVEASRAGAQASAADLAAARLSAQSTLAQTYFQLRVLDEQERLLRETVDTNQRSLELTMNRYEAGVAAKSDVAVARTQLENARAQWVDLEWQRGQFEHAIAVLLGQAPSKFSLARAPFTQRVPAIPVGLPSQLLERRPDVAGAERRTAQANAQIGVAQAAWFPDLTLTADGGFRSGQFAQWLTAPARFWSIGPALAQTLFDAGLRASQVESARAAYDAQAAAYRQTVLGALREVEDTMIQLRVFEREQEIQQRALQAARESLELTRNQYKQGLVDYLSVAVLENTALSSERTAISLMGNRLVASVQLIAALGGGWDGNVDTPMLPQADGAEPAPAEASAALESGAAPARTPVAPASAPMPARTSATKDAATPRTRP
ncbi:efflux transporter outer membrane subunit [Bordetella genomosp. 9]|uniref:RND transporter n=1 Tax=Bordetella genomosp. 9 TaxID=1416803 RepID=A0A1W6Z3L9_9BORD|nr:efflux transporter outer membrane subunit [Bordetella genomosp. 9]ARP87995.1 RND transporter [Bordetella genomosp. 9]